MSISKIKIGSTDFIPLNANNITGQINVSNLGTGTASNTNFLRGDASWQEITIPEPPDAPDIEVFNSPGTWTKPATVRRIKITVVGAGGGGTSGYNEAGGGGGTAIKYIPAPTIPGPVSVTVSAANTGVGGSSSFGPFASATGGGSGAQPAAGGIGTGGDINLKGQGSSRITGGSSSFGGGGMFNTNADSIGAGGGASPPGTPEADFKLGGPGVVIVEEFY